MGWLLVSFFCYFVPPVPWNDATYDSSITVQNKAGSTSDYILPGQFNVRLMEEILQLLIGSFSHYLQGFMHPRCFFFGISEPPFFTINSSPWKMMLGRWGNPFGSKPTHHSKISISQPANHHQVNGHMWNIVLARSVPIPRCHMLDGERFGLVEKLILDIDLKENFGEKYQCS